MQGLKHKAAAPTQVHIQKAVDTTWQQECNIKQWHNSSWNNMKQMQHGSNIHASFQGRKHFRQQNSGVQEWEHHNTATKKNSEGSMHIHMHKHEYMLEQTLVLCKMKTRNSANSSTQ